MICTRCENTGFLNIEQVPEGITDPGDILDWIAEQKRSMDRIGGCSCFQRAPCSWCMLQHDVQVCDCCGDGESWHGQPGEHNYVKGGCEPLPGCI